MGAGGRCWIISLVASFEFPSGGKKRGDFCRENMRTVVAVELRRVKETGEGEKNCRSKI